MRSSFHTFVTSLVFGVTAAPWAWAQSAPPAPSPKNDPALNNPNLDPALRQPVPRPEEVKPVDPTPGKTPQSQVPTLPAPDSNLIDPSSLPEARFVPEGTFVVDRTGKLIVSEGGDVILVPAAGAGDAKPLPLMVLLPCQKLEQMLASRAANGNDAAFNIAGQVFTYRDREFLLPTVFALARSGTTAANVASPIQETKAAKTAKEPGPTSPAPTGGRADQDPRVADLIRELDSARSAPKRIMPAAEIKSDGVVPAATAAAPSAVGAAQQSSSQSAVKKPGEPLSVLANEGTILVSRRGRIVRLASDGGRLAFVVDNDPNSPGAAPMILEPCRMMQQIEGMASTRGDELVYRVSGRVMVYSGKNYLLPTFFQLAPRTDVTPRQ